MGYGASMDMIYHSPHVADLLISMAAAAANNPQEHRQRFFACPNPPSDFVDDLARASCALALQPHNTMGIKWAELQQVGWCCLAIETLLAHLISMMDSDYEADP